MNVLNFKESTWWWYLDESMRDLVEESIELLDHEERRIQEFGDPLRHDYSFVVFPMAKSYEGFLKKAFYDLGFINVRQYKGDRFRIGRSLNPDLPKRYRWDWVYGKLAELCIDSSLPNEMWDLWKRARNRLFHYFPNHQEFISLNEARRLVEEIAQVMEKTLIGCKLDKS